ERRGEAEAGRGVGVASQDYLGRSGRVHGHRQALVVQQADAVVAGIRRQLVDLGAQRVELRGQRRAGRVRRARGGGVVDGGVRGGGVEAQGLDGGGAGGVGGDADRSGAGGGLDQDPAVTRELGAGLVVAGGAPPVDEVS